MSIFNELAKSLSSSNKSSISSNRTTNSNAYNPKPTTWQCRYCSRRTTTYGNSVPRQQICHGRGKTNTGHPKMCDWRKIG